jgi:hypothetical protein
MKPSIAGRSALAASLAVALALVAVGPTQAYDIPPPPPALYQGMIFLVDTTVPIRTSSQRYKPSSGSKQPKAAESPTKVADAASLGKPQVQAEMYRQLETKLGMQPDDVACALAAFVAGNYMVYRNVEVPDATFQRIAEQIRASLASNEGFTQATPDQRRSLYEQSAMVGTFMAVARLEFQKQPNPNAERNFRDSAAANLEAALKVPADKVRITEQGLALQ